MQPIILFKAALLLTAVNCFSNTTHGQQPTIINRKIELKDPARIEFSYAIVEPKIPTKVEFHNTKIELKNPARIELNYAKPEPIVPAKLELRSDTVKRQPTPGVL